ncbi:MAG: ferredoxin [Candidatus Nanohaloarchaeota archaeon QJJ-9]|nr:ferredoxin [Candidatus Nanohaloarchaeota archaeon QJJ-9]
MDKDLYIDEDKCIGCSSCVSIAPAVFEMEGVLAKVKEEVEFDEEVLEKAQEAAEFCPTDAITVEKD